MASKRQQKRRSARSQGRGRNVSSSRIDAVQQGRVADEAERTPSEAERIEAQAAIDDFFRKIPALIEERRERIRASMERFDAFDVLANLLLRNVPQNPETYRESAHDGLMAYVEYAALILTERSTRAAISPQVLPIGQNEMDLWMSELEEIVRLSMWEKIRYRKGGEEPTEQARASVRAQILNRELFLRNPVYDWQEEATLRSLFSEPDIENALKERVGFTIDDALKLQAAFSEERVKRFGNRLDSAQAFSNNLLRRLEQLRKKPHMRLKEHEEPLTDFLTDSRRSAKKSIEKSLWAWAWLGIGSSFALSASDLAATSGVDVEIVKSFAEFFSSRFGENPEPTVILEGHHRIRQRPIIDDGQGCYLCMSPGNLLFALRSRLEEALKVERPEFPSRWQRYNGIRKTYVETRAANLIATALKTNQIWRNAKYTIDGGDENELDALVVVGTVGFIVEAKAASLFSPARRGAPGRLKRDVEDVLSHASTQAERLRKALEADADVIIKHDGKEIHLDAPLTRLFSVAVILDDFSGFGAKIWELAEAGLLEVAEPIPWIVTVDELEIIVDLLQYPGMLPDYLLRRRRLNELKLVHASDELDLFIHYLYYGLIFDEFSDGDEVPDAIFLQSLTDDLDAYYNWLHGVRKTKARKPQQKIVGDFKMLMDALDECPSPHRIEVEMAVLGLDGEGRLTIGRQFNRLRVAATQDNEFHDVTFVHGVPDGGSSCAIGSSTSRPSCSLRL